MIFETDHHLKDRKITLIVFRGSSYPRTFDVPLSWINHLGWIVGFFLFALTLSTGLGVKFYLKLKQVDTSKVESLQRELDELRLKGSTGLVSSSQSVGSEVKSSETNANLVLAPVAAPISGQQPVAVVSAGPSVVTGTVSKVAEGIPAVSNSAAVGSSAEGTSTVGLPASSTTETKQNFIARAKTFFTNLFHKTKSPVDQPSTVITGTQNENVPITQTNGIVNGKPIASPLVGQATGNQSVESTVVSQANPNALTSALAPGQESVVGAGSIAKPSVSTATSAFSSFAQYFFPKEFFAPVAGRDQVPIQLTPIKITYQGKILNVKTAIQYNRNDGQSQSGHFIVVGRTPDAVFVYPSGVIQDVTQSALLNPARGEYFSVGRYREIDADLGPLEARGTVQYVEVFLFNNANQPIYYERARPQ